MNKPNNYEKTQAFGDFEPLKIGGHICRIMKVEETESKMFKPMLKIYLDIAEGEQSGYYREQYENDTRQDKKWGCIVYQLTEDENGNMNRGFKTFTTSVEESNPDFKIEWGDNKSAFENCFKDKLVGGIFRNEQYEKKDGSLGWSVKCYTFRSVERIRAGVKAPEDKYINNSAPIPAPTGFEIPDDSSGKLPF